MGAHSAELYALHGNNSRVNVAKNRSTGLMFKVDWMPRSRLPFIAVAMQSSAEASQKTYPSFAFQPLSLS
jgi:hypothetical protein